MPPPLARETPPTTLTFRHRMMAVLMVRGCSDANLLGLIERQEKTKDERGKTVFRPASPPAPGEPLEADEAGRLAGLRKRFARALAETEIFKSQLAIERKRAGLPEPEEDEDDAD